jgi:hypothetical protein
MAYTRQGYLRQQVRCTETPTGVDIDFSPREGNYQPWWHQMTVRVHHWQGDALASLDGKHQSNPIVHDGVLSLTIDAPRRKSHLSLR